MISLFQSRCPSLLGVPVRLSLRAGFGARRSWLRPEDELRASAFISVHLRFHCPCFPVLGPPSSASLSVLCG
jgi:hypothetical protein